MAGTEGAETSARLVESMPELIQRQGCRLVRGAPAFMPGVTPHCAARAHAVPLDGAFHDNEASLGERTEVSS
ncbi:hypothetical protein [Microbispora sp. NBRC 16548]|uniref:hypothetical protein n=1 Tax=Microbispora sp. NBRC 16548 TaxID=3030994 RepID=UPI002554EFC7|nr:hypothetical protein [Microbispora sp. NBRC 16548]